MSVLYGRIQKILYAKQILDYYAANVQDQKLDKYLEKMDYRQYAQVDRTTLLEVSDLQKTVSSGNGDL